MNFVKNLLIFFLVASAGFYTALFLYHYRQHQAEQIEALYQIPEYLTENFWKSVNPDQLKEKLQTIKNINEVRLDNGRSMLHLLAIYGKYPEMVSLLIDKGIDYNLMDTAEEVKALHYAAKRKEQALEFTKEFAKYHANIDEIGGSGGTALMKACYWRVPVEVVKFLLEQGADPNHQSKRGTTPLISATHPMHNGNRFINPEVIQLLLDYKADINIRNSDGDFAYDLMKENEEFKKTELFKKISKKFQFTSDNQKKDLSQKNKK